MQTRQKWNFCIHETASTLQGLKEIYKFFLKFITYCQPFPNFCIIIRLLQQKHDYPDNHFLKIFLKNTNFLPKSVTFSGKSELFNKKKIDIRSQLVRIIVLQKS